MLAGAILVAYAAAFMLAAVSDAARYTIPNEVILALLALFALACFAYPDIFDWRGNLITGAAVFAVGAAMFFIRWMGAGDAKLLGLAALWAGADSLIVWGLVLALAGLALVSGLLLARRIRSSRSAGPVPEAPRILHPGAPVPYGIAISAAALWMIGTDSSLRTLWQRAAEAVT